VPERKERKRMVDIISKEQLQNGNLFQGGAYGGIPISFFWMQLPPDEGPRLHFHPYAEIFVILEGQATFTLGESTVEVAAGNIVIGPANVPHKFSNAGEGILRIVTLHPSPKTIGTRVED
jgi:mannose-6-phosphate isomerase-like protein (cupin superfamily)